MEAKVNPLTRKDIPEEAKWDLKGLYLMESLWQEDINKLEKDLAGYEPFKGTLANSAKSIKLCLDFDISISRTIEKLYTYAHLRNDEDKTHSQNQSNFEKMVRLNTLAAQASSYIPSELMAISEDQMNRFLEDKELDFYKLHLERILRYRKYTLSEKEEKLLASSSEIARTARSAFEMLDNADLKLGTVQDENGNDLAITQGNFQSIMQNQDRRVRKEAFDTFYTAYSDHQYTYASLLASNIKKDTFYAREKNYASVREKSMFSENIPIKVYDNLIATVHENMAPLHKYFFLRKNILKLDQIHIYDMSVPLVKDIHWHLGYDDSVAKILDSLQLLGSDYTKSLKKGLVDDRWVDRYESKGKRSGAYSSGCYDSNPFILMNYREDNINSLYTLAHEAGHSMHSFLSRKKQPYLYADYTIFVAEVASTFNEVLLTKYLLLQNIDKSMKIYLICREIDNLRGTLYRQTMFAEFEHLVYAAAESGQPMTLEIFKEFYRKLLEKYFSEDTILDENLSLECFRIPHFYFSFYVYKYATGISAAYALAEMVSEGGTAEKNNYLNFLKSGGSKYPIDLLKGAGVDMTSPEPVETVLKKFSALVNQLEALTN
jgi:oligoendopeptidase F